MYHSIKIMFFSFYLILSPVLIAKTSNNDEVLKRRGALNIGNGTEKPTISLSSPTGGWTVNQMIPISGSCSDKTASPI